MPKLTREINELRDRHEDDTAVELQLGRTVDILQRLMDVAMADGRISRDEAPLLREALAVLGEQQQRSLAFNRSINAAYCRLSGDDYQPPLFAELEEVGG